MGILGEGLLHSRPEEAVLVFEACLALFRRCWPHDDVAILLAQGNLASSLDRLGRPDEALVLTREVYAGFAAKLGVSHERTILNGFNLSCTLVAQALYDEARTLLTDQLLPAARQTLGPDHDHTLDLNRNLAAALMNNPEHTCDEELEAETIMQGVVQRRRRVFGPAHPETRRAEEVLSAVRGGLIRGA